MRTHLGTVLMIGLFAGVAGAVAWQAYSRSDAEGTGPAPSTQAAPVAVEVAPVESGIVRDTRVLAGTLEASTRFVVAAKVGGLIENVVVDLGGRIQRGQLVAEIDDAEFVQAAAQAESELIVRQAARQQAATALELADRDFKRVERLNERGMAAESELDDKYAALKSNQAALALADAQVRQAEAALELARIRLGYTEVRAAWSGGDDTAIVGERFQDAGNTVQAGDPIIAVVALQPLTAVVSITERDYTSVSIGQQATLTTDALPDRTFPATVVRISPVFREASRQARIELRVENTERLLKPGMFVRVTIVLREEHAEAIVPLAALAKREGRNVVFLLDETTRRVRLVPVRVGIIQDERVQVFGTHITGRVVVLGQQLLRDGAPVTVSETDHAAPVEGTSQ